MRSINKVEVYKILASVVLLMPSACLPRGSDYYSDKAYAAIGIEEREQNPNNVVAYMPGDPRAQKRIDEKSRMNDHPITSIGSMQRDPTSMTPQEIMMQYSGGGAPGNHNGTSTKLSSAPTVAENTSSGQNALHGMQNANNVMPFALGNTGNHSSNLNPSRSVNDVNINDNHYQVYLNTLANEYQRYAQLFISKGMQNDAQLLHSKSATASTGNDVVFETEYSFDLPVDKKAIISKQRKVLENAKARIEVLKQMPQEMAKMQASYDCMVLEANNRMYSTQTMCGVGYFSALNAIEKRFGSMSVAQGVNYIAKENKVEEVVEAPVEDIAPVPTVPVAEKQSHFVQNPSEYVDKALLTYDNHKSFVVYYDVGSASLDVSAIYAINKAIAFAQEYDDYKINVLGFTDRLGSRDYNKQLSEKRVDQTVKALIERGIPKEKLNKVVFGEDYNSVNTRDGVGESFNRRVVIEVDATATFDEDTFIMQKASENIIVK